MKRDAARDAAIAVYGDLVRRPRNDREGNSTRRRSTGRAVIVGPNGRQRGNARAGVGGEEGIEARAESVDGEGAARGGGPGVPDGFAAGVAAVIGLAGFLVGPDIRAGEGGGGAGDERAVGEEIVGGGSGRAEVEVKRDGAADAAVAIDGDLVGGSGDRVESDFAGGGAAGGAVVVGGDRSEGGNAGAGVDRE